LPVGRWPTNPAGDAPLAVVVAVVLAGVTVAAGADAVEGVVGCALATGDAEADEEWEAVDDPHAARNAVAPTPSATARARRALRRYRCRFCPLSILWSLNMLISGIGLLRSRPPVGALDGVVDASGLARRGRMLLTTFRAAFRS
jgi:hypothetical protein